MKTAVITGASGGIGRALVEKFIDQGYFVLAQYNNGVANIEGLRQRLTGAGKADYFFTVKADLSCKEGISDMQSAMQNTFDHVDLLINNAGVDLYGLCEDSRIDEVERLFSVNLKSAYMLSATALKSMTARKRGKIIFISSIWGLVGGAMETAYSASKGGLITLTKALAKEAGYNGVTVNCICPGVIDTAMNARYTEDERVALIASTPVGRFGLPEEVADLAVFIASDKGDFITGQAITVDGGFAL